MATGFILMFDVQDAYESTINMYHARTCWLPISTVASGNAVNAFPSAGTLQISSPSAWDMSYLPAL